MVITDDLLTCVREDRAARGLAPDHCRPDEMGFPAKFGPQVAAFAASGDGPQHDGLAWFIAGNIASAEAAWAPLRAAAARQGNVLACCNFDPAWHAGLRDYTGWPEVHGTRGLPGPTVFIACDGKYFDKFAAALIVSIRQESQVAVHLHLMDPNDAQLAAARSMTNDGLTWEYPNGNAGYYHAVRFVRFRELLEHYGELLLLDADQLANGDPLELFTAEPLAMRFRPGRVEPWNQINASAVYGRWPGTAEYFTRVAAYITAHRKQLFWGIDQMAMYAVWAMGCRPEACGYGPAELDYDYRAGVIWPNSGQGKHSRPEDRPRFHAKFLACQALTSTPEGLAAQGRLVECMEAVAARWNEREVAFPKAGPRKIGRFVYLPVEITARELRSKAWLAGEMARRGYQVLLGATWEMMAERFTDLPPGLVLFKTLNAIDAANIGYAQNAGHLAAVLNEEFFALKPDRWLYETEIHKNALQNADIICAQGEAQAEILAGLAGPGRVRTSGNYRAVQEGRIGIVERSLVHNRVGGLEILVPMMCGTISNLLAFPEFMRVSFNVFGNAGPDVREHIRQQIVHETECRALMLDAIAEIAASNPDRTVRVRPHPAEDPTTYAALREKHANVIVDDRTPFSERLKDAAIVVFTSGCATGVEAVLAGKLAIRVGEGGHGISQDLGLAYHPGRVMALLVSHGRLATGPDDGKLDGHFAPCTLPAVLDEFATEHAMPMKVDLATVMACRDAPFKPKPFHENKFGAVDDAEIAALTGANVKRVGWGLWTINAG